MTSFRLTRNLVDQFPRFATNGGSATGSYSANAVLKRNDLSQFPWSPLNQAGLLAWGRADKGITLNGSNVSAWAEQVGTNNMVQNTAGNQPAFIASGSLNSQPCVRTQASGSKLLIGTLATHFSSKNLTVIVVGTPTFGTSRRLLRLQ